jgi:hypothetical protein
MVLTSSFGTLGHASLSLRDGFQENFIVVKAGFNFSCVTFARRFGL